MSHVNEQRVFKETPTNKSSLAAYVADTNRTEALIGLQCVVEMKVADTDASIIKCNMCNIKGIMATMKSHFSGIHHIKRYMEKFYSSVLASLKQSATDTTHFTKLLKDYAKEIERAERKRGFKIEYVTVAQLTPDEKCMAAQGINESGVEQEEEKSEVVNKRQMALNYSKTFKITSREEATVVLKLTQQLSDQLEKYFLKYKGLSVLNSTTLESPSSTTGPEPTNSQSVISENLQSISAAKQGLTQHHTAEPSSSRPSTCMPTSVHSYDRMPLKDSRVEKQKSDAHQRNEVPDRREKRRDDDSPRRDVLPDRRERRRDDDSPRRDVLPDRRERRRDDDSPRRAVLSDRRERRRDDDSPRRDVLSDRRKRRKDDSPRRDVLPDRRERRRDDDSPQRDVLPDRRERRRDDDSPRRDVLSDRRERHKDDDSHRRDVLSDRTKKRKADELSDRRERHKDDDSPRCNRSSSSEFQSRNKRPSKEYDDDSPARHSSSSSYMNVMASPPHSSAEVSSYSSTAASYTKNYYPIETPCVPETFWGPMPMVNVPPQNYIPQNSINYNISKTEAVQENESLNSTPAAETSEEGTGQSTAVPEPSSSDGNCSSEPSSENPSSSHTQGKTSKTLSPDILHLLRGKDANTVSNILRTLSPFYPALQEVNIEMLSQVLANTGALD